MQIYFIPGTFVGSRISGWNNGAQYKTVQFIKQKIPEALFYKGLGILKWYLQGSNQGHMDFQSIALPSELRYLANAGANIGWFLIYPKQILKKINSYLRIIKDKLWF